MTTIFTTIYDDDDSVWFTGEGKDNKKHIFLLNIKRSRKKDENCNNVKNMITFSFKKGTMMARIREKVNYVFLLLH